MSSMNDDKPAKRGRSARLRITLAAAMEMRPLDAGELARRFGVSRWAIYKRLARAGYRRQARFGPREWVASQLGSSESPLDLDRI